MTVDKLKVSQALRKLEKELLNANRLLAERKQIEESLKAVFEQADFLEQQSDQDVVFTAFFKELADHRKLIAEFKKLELGIAELKKLLQEIEEQRLRADLFFENFRDSRTYYFQEAGKAFEFIKQAFENYSLEKAFFKPQFLGLGSLNETISKFDLQKTANQSLIVSKEKIPDFLSHLLSKNLLRKSRLDNESLRILFNTANELFIETDNAKIRRLDAIARELNAEVWEA